MTVLKENNNSDYINNEKKYFNILIQLIKILTQNNNKNQLIFKSLLANQVIEMKFSKYNLLKILNIIKTQNAKSTSNQINKINKSQIRKILKNKENKIE